MRILRAIHRGLDCTIFALILLILIGLITGYRMTLSPIIGPTCRFHPSCSAYGLESIKVHGAAKGTTLIVWRLLRCNPWNLGGLDPVPDRGHWHPSINPDGTPRVKSATITSYI